MPSAVLSIISWQKWFGACLGINNMIICRGISISQLCRTRGEWQWLGSSSTARAPVRGIDPPGKLCYQTWNCHYWEHLSYILHHIICNIRIYFDIYIYIHIIIYSKGSQTDLRQVFYLVNLVIGQWTFQRRHELLAVYRPLKEPAHHIRVPHMRPSSHSDSPVCVCDSGFCWSWCLWSFTVMPQQ